MKYRRPIFVLLAVALALAASLPAAADFTFAVGADPRPGSCTKADGSGWRSCLSAIRQWQAQPPEGFQAPEFLVVVGDMDPVSQTEQGVREILGPQAVWYPVVGNHDLGQADRALVRDVIFPTLPGVVNRGPKGSEGLMYSFDHGGAHFIVLNEYYDGNSETGASGDITDATMAWLKDDLERSAGKEVFVFGHEPAFPEHRHVGDSLDRFPKHRDAFWALLSEHRVNAFFVGHTHYWSRLHRQGVWQVDAGQMRGVFAKGSNDRRSTVVLVSVGDAGVRYAAMQATGDAPFYFTPAASWFEARAVPAAAQ